MADSLILACNVIFFSKYRLPKKIMSDAGDIFISETFKELCRNLNIEQEISSSYHHQSNGQLKECIRFINQTLTICFETNAETYIVYFRLDQLHLGQPYPVLQIIIQLPYKGHHASFNMAPINMNEDDDHYEVLVERLE